MRQGAFPIRDGVFSGLDIDAPNSLIWKNLGVGGGRLSFLNQIYSSCLLGASFIHYLKTNLVALPSPAFLTRHLLQLLRGGGKGEVREVTLVVVPNLQGQKQVRWPGASGFHSTGAQPGR